MSDPIRHELREDLHGATLGDAVACDYHQRPMEIPTDAALLAEAIRIVDHPQLTELPDGWVIDAARCDDHAVEALEEPTRGFEEALVHLPLTVSNDVVSVSVPDSDAVRVLDFAPATEGCRPMVLDRPLLDAVDPADHGLSRWQRVVGMLNADPPTDLREHIEGLIDSSPDVPPPLR